MLRRFTRTPLLVKLIVVDAAANVFAFLVMQWLPPLEAERVMLLSLFGVLVVNAALVAWALTPLRVLEETAVRVSSGEMHARAAMPWLADRNLMRIGDTLNTLLDSLGSERLRVRKLAGLVVAASDAERSRIARELHDGTAQALSALDMLLASVLSEVSGDVTERLATMKIIVGDALVEVRTLAQGMHPQVLEDLGLMPALEQLARQGEVGRSVEIEVEGDVPALLPAVSASVLYRVAQEALHNALKHADATHIQVTVTADDGSVEVRVKDDGRGFEHDAPESRGGMGLFVMKERVSLLDGSLTLRSAAGQGTEVIGRIPLLDETE